jgi:hypothetical protein
LPESEAAKRNARLLQAGVSEEFENLWLSTRPRTQMAMVVMAMMRSRDVLHK